MRASGDSSNPRKRCRRGGCNAGLGAGEARHALECVGVSIVMVLFREGAHDVQLPRARAVRIGRHARASYTEPRFVCCVRAAARACLVPMRRAARSEAGVVSASEAAARHARQHVLHTRTQARVRTCRQPRHRCDTTLNRGWAQRWGATLGTRDSEVGRSVGRGAAAATVRQACASRRLGVPR